MNNSWIYLSFLATFITAIVVLFLKYIDTTKYDNIVFLNLTFVIAGLLSLIYLLCNFNKTKSILHNFEYNIFYLVLFFAIVLILNNIIIQYALKMSPNVGYCHLIINLNIIITLIVGYFFFKQKINYKTLLGILITLLGASMVIYNSNNN